MNEELEALCDKLADETLTPEEARRLEKLVLENPEMRRAYVERMHVNAALHGESVGDRPLADVVAQPQRRTRRWLLAVVPLAAAIALWFARPGSPAVATLVASKGCRWEGGALPTEPGAHLPAGRLRLTEGLATIAFASGAEVKLEAPADLELVSAMEAVLHRGSLVAHVPPRARGFQVRSGDTTLIDHGTEFGLTADGTGGSEVRVLDGLVEARHGRTGEQLRLATGEGAVFGQEKILSRGSMADSPEQLLRAMTAPTVVGDLAVSSSFGRGRATFVQRNVSATAPPVLLVKNTQQPLWMRKAFVAFDMSTLRGRPVASATLSFALAATGLGYASFVPDAEFAIYGVTDEALDGWQETGLAWDDAPANGAGPADVDAARTVRLGSFVVPQGAVGGTFGIGGPELASFLARDRDGVVTFVLVRTTRETRLTGLVHGFAGNHHPFLPPPMLRIALSK